MLTYAPLILVVPPLLIAAVLGMTVRRAGAIAPWLAVLGPAATAVYGFQALGAAASEEGGVVASGALRWFAVGDVAIPLTWAVDAWTAVMLVVVGVVASCVVVFSVGYMAGERGWVRYFGLISLFTGAMNLLVIAASFPALFMGWELVGACSYLLIGFWYEKPSASAAAVKAFLTTRVGDVGLLLGIAVLWAATDSATYAGAAKAIGGVPTSVTAAAAIGIAIGAIGKSAQFPLHAWLPDAMEGPTPVSALIHAATMVAAGVFVVVRLPWLFEAAPAARVVLLAAGIVAAFAAALAAVAQRDIKKMLAYSTISQLGFMFVALGTGAWIAAFFHLVTHAAFKALLFLTSGSVIHGTGTQDMHEMGGLRGPMKSTTLAWVVGVLALSGVPGLSGFFSKDLILEQVWHMSAPLGFVLLAASALTAFYSARSTRLVFFGTLAEDAHPHESGLTMLAPLAVLSVAAVALGWFGGPLAHALGGESEPLALALTAAAVASALAGGVAGWLAVPRRDHDPLAERLGYWWALLRSGYRWDALVDRAVVVPVVAGARALWAFGDRLLTDGAVEGLGSLSRRAGRSLSGLQTGDGQGYAAAIAVGFVLMLVITVWAGR